MIYLDSSAAAKLVHAESQAQALRDWLDERAVHGGACVAGGGMGGRGWVEFPACR